MPQPWKRWTWRLGHRPCAHGLSGKAEAPCCRGLGSGECVCVHPRTPAWPLRRRRRGLREKQLRRAGLRSRGHMPIPALQIRAFVRSLQSSGSASSSLAARGVFCSNWVDTVYMHGRRRPDWMGRWSIGDALSLGGGCLFS